MLITQESLEERRSLIAQQDADFEAALEADCQKVSVCGQNSFCII